nr:NADH(P)-binding [uncultured organism]
MNVPASAPASEGRTAWLAGATGLVGSLLLARLLDASVTVHALVRRLPDAPRTHPGLHYHPVDFAHLPALPPADDVYIALGTTIKAAGSREAFRRVDFDAVVRTAEAARAAGVRRIGLVSAVGADPASTVFYNRVKGEAEQAIAKLGFEVAVFARPALLLGDREALGQPARFGEQIAERVMLPLGALLPRAIRPVQADAVAASIIESLRTRPPGQHTLSSQSMQPRRT